MKPDTKCCIIYLLDAGQKMVCYQNAPQIYLPIALKNDNPMSIIGLVNGKFTTDKIDA